MDDVLRQLAAGSTDYESLLPDVLRKAHPESVRQYRDAKKRSRRLTRFNDQKAVEQAFQERRQVSVLS